MGLAVAVDRRRGVVGVWSGGEDGPPLQALPLPPDLPDWIPATGAARGSARDHEQDPERDDGPLLVTAPGRWLRRFADGDGGFVVERGLVLDEASLLLLEWAPAGLNDRGHRVALLGAEVDPAAARRLLADPPSRARIREARGTPYPDEAFVLKAARAGQGARDVEAGRVVPGDARVGERHGGGKQEEGEEVLREALAVLDGASLGPIDDEVDPLRPHPRESPGPFILQGAAPQGAPGAPPPELLEGAGLAEYGLAALMAGRWGVARKILTPSGATPDAPISQGMRAPLPFLLLAARWCLWTGQPLPGSGPGGGAGPEGGALDAWVEGARTQARDEVDGGPAQAGAAFPPLSRVLEELADGLEGLGDPGRPRQFRTWAEEIRRPSAPLKRATGLRLPVLGNPMPNRPASPLPDPRSGATSGGGAPEPPAPRPPRAVLPPPTAFGPLTTPAILPRQTLHAARLVRSWVEGVLGAEPDAPSGRLALSLDLRALPVQGSILGMENLRVGDSRVALDCRGDGGVLTFRIFQNAGRVPLNLIFQLLLPSPRVARVWMGDEIVEVEETETPWGVRLRCQFPLDPERRLIIETGD